MTTPRPDKWIRTASREDLLVDVAVRTLRGRLDGVRHALELAAEHPDDAGENVHQLRVSSRRAAAALALYQDLIPRRRRAWMRRQLKHIRRAAGDARDCDVLAQRQRRKRSTAAPKRWEESLCAERAEAQEAIRSIWHRLRRRDQLARRIDALLERVEAQAGKPCSHRPACFAPWGRAHLQEVADRFFAAVPADPDDDAGLHRLRIRTKKLRYVMELVAGAFPERFRSRLYPTIAEVQDRLGSINDRVTAAVRLQRQIAAEDDVTEVAVLRRLLNYERAQIRAAKRRFWRWFAPATVRDLRHEFATVVREPLPTSWSETCRRLSAATGQPRRRETRPQVWPPDPRHIDQHTALRTVPRPSPGWLLDPVAR